MNNISVEFERTLLIQQLLMKYKHIEIIYTEKFKRLNKKRNFIEKYPLTTWYIDKYYSKVNAEKFWQNILQQEDSSGTILNVNVSKKK